MSLSETLSFVSIEKRLRASGSRPLTLDFELDVRAPSRDCSVMSRTREIYVPPGGPGEMPPLSAEIFQSMGEEGIFAMLEAFYLELEASEIRALFPEDVVAASKRSAAFYVQLLGGPPLYNLTYGNPMMRRRHFPFEIDEEKRLIWLGCFNRVLDGAADRFGFPDEHLPAFRKWLDGFSQWMVNVA